MSLRARLVVAVLALFAVGLTVFGVGTYQTFALAEQDRLSADLDDAVGLVVRELLIAAGRGEEMPGRWSMERRVAGLIVAPGTYAELVDADGAVLASLQVAGEEVRPDLSGLTGDALGQVSTVDSIGADLRWLATLQPVDQLTSVRVAVPMAALERRLDRLLTIQLVAGGALLALLAAGTWLILRRGLSPLERIAASAGSITAGVLDRRVEVGSAAPEIEQLATAINGMLAELEAAFLQRDATEARLRRFLADASHELRTPLTSIQGYAELYRLGADDDPAGLMRRIESEATRMRRLVEDLLVLARLDEPRAAVPDTVDMADLARQVLRDAETLDPERRVTLDATGAAWVRGDAGQLHRALRNLVVNAVTHTPPGTPVRLEVSPEQDRVVVSVRDHGPGVDPEHREHLFERFWQADPARSGSGTGLGLAIVKAIIAEHGGEVRYEDADTGARFIIDLPALGEHPPPPPPAPCDDPEVTR